MLALAVGVRVMGLWGLGQTLHAKALLVDAHLYWEQAAALAAGQDPFTEGLYQPPGYPLFLAGIAALGGELGAVRLVQAGLGVLSTWLVLRLGRGLGRRLEAPWLGALAAALYTLSPTLLLFEQDLLTPALSGALFLGALSVAAPLWEGDALEVPERSSTALRSAASGLLLGLGAVVHASLLVAAGALTLALLLLRRRLAAGLVFLGLLVALAPTTALNASRFGTLTPVSHNAGLNAWLGNGAHWKETHFLRPGIPFRVRMMEAEPWARDLAERDVWWGQRARAEALSAPGVALEVLATKALWSVSAVEIPRNEDMRCRLELPGLSLLSWLPVRWGWGFPLAVLGLAGLWRRCRADAVIYGVLWLSLQAGLVVFLVADRYRLGAWPLVALLAAVGLRELGLMLRGLRAGRRPGLLWLGLIPVALLPWLPLDPVTDLDPAWCAHTQGSLRAETRDIAGARAAMEEAVRLDPSDVNAWEWLGRAAALDGDPAAALVSYEELVSREPTYVPGLLAMARVAAKAGQLPRAQELARQAYEVPPHRPEAGEALLSLLRATGRSEEAAALLAKDPRLSGGP